MSGEQARISVLADGTIFEGEPGARAASTTGEVVFTTGDDRLPRGAHRSVVLRADRHDDRAARSATPASTREDTESVDARPHVAGLHRARREPDRLELARRADARRLPRAATASSRISGIDTREPHASPARSRLAERRDRDRRPPERSLRKAREAPVMAGPRSRAARSRPRSPTRSPKSRGSLAAPAPARRSRERARRRHRLRPQAQHPALPGRRRAAGSRSCPRAPAPTDILALRPDGVFLSNGPGDPAAVTYAIETVQGPARQEAASSASASAISSSRSRSAARPTS